MCVHLGSCFSLMQHFCWLAVRHLIGCTFFWRLLSNALLLRRYSNFVIGKKSMLLPVVGASRDLYRCNRYWDEGRFDTTGAIDYMLLMDLDSVGTKYVYQWTWRAEHRFAKYWSTVLPVVCRNCQYSCTWMRTSYAYISNTATEREPYLNIYSYVGLRSVLVVRRRITRAYHSPTDVVQVPSIVDSW